jgi:hypothetical protein
LIKGHKEIIKYGEGTGVEILLLRDWAVQRDTNSGFLK